MGYEENDESLIPEIQQMLDDFESTYAVSYTHLDVYKRQISYVREYYKPVRVQGRTG